MNLTEAAFATGGSGTSDEIDENSTPGLTGPGAAHGLRVTGGRGKIGGKATY